MIYELFGPCNPAWELVAWSQEQTTLWLQEAREHIALWGVPLDSLSGDKIQQRQG